MSQYVFKLPDLGEGTVEAEVVEWHVKPGDQVSEDDALVDMMTDKASVEVPSPVAGRVLEVSGQPGDKVAVGAQLALIETEQAPADDAASESEPQAEASVPTPAEQPEQPASAPKAEQAAAERKVEEAAGPAREEPAAPPAKPPAGAAEGGKVLTSPSIRRRAREAGVDLSRVSGTGPRGRILPEDLDRYLAAPHADSVPAGLKRHGTEEIKVIGLRRIIAERLSASKRSIPHFAYVEEVDVTELEALRAHLNRRAGAGAALSYLPFIALALIRVLREFPQCNALYDGDRGVIVRHHAVHFGIATQTADGLKVPVVRHAESRGLEDMAAEIRRVTEAARDGSATREELAGSTITITSLGRLGGIVSTPVINAPEVAIIGVNRAVERPTVLGGGVAIRRMMNLSSSFDHRFVDGYDAAAMIQALKGHLEHPATIFI